MEFAQRETLEPLIATFSTSAHRLPTAVMAAVVRLCPDRQFDHHYLDARYTADNGVAFDFYWIRGDVFGHVSASSNDARWQDIPVNDKVDHRISARIRRLPRITTIELGQQYVALESWGRGTLTVEGPISIAFVDEDDPVSLGGDNPKNAGDRAKRDQFVDTLLRRFYA